MNSLSSPLQLFQCGRFLLDYRRPLIMGVLNLTPDSFSDGGKFTDTTTALGHAEKLLKEGADILDIGAQSSRPGAQEIGTEEEWRRLEPILKEVSKWNIPISVDTYRPLIMQRALEAGVDMINDIEGFRSDESHQIIANSNAGICVMHMQNTPLNMQQNAHYQDLLQEVSTFLIEQTRRFLIAGVAPNRICIDPGFGFGKHTIHNLTLLRDLAIFSQTVALQNFPLLTGWSRKSSLGEITGRPVSNRLASSLGAALIAIQNGARIVRVHDVAATKDIVLLWHAIASLSDS